MIRSIISGALFLTSAVTAQNAAEDPLRRFRSHRDSLVASAWHARQTVSNWRADSRDDSKSHAYLFDGRPSTMTTEVSWDRGRHAGTGIDSRHEQVPPAYPTHHAYFFDGTASISVQLRGRKAYVRQGLLLPPCVTWPHDWLDLLPGSPVAKMSSGLQEFDTTVVDGRCQLKAEIGDVMLFVELTDQGLVRVVERRSRKSGELLSRRAVLSFVETPIGLLPGVGEYSYRSQAPGCDPIVITADLRWEWSPSARLGTSDVHAWLCACATVKFANRSLESRSSYTDFLLGVRDSSADSRTTSPSEIRIPKAAGKSDMTSSSLADVLKEHAARSELLDISSSYCAHACLVVGGLAESMDDAISMLPRAIVPLAELSYAAESRGAPLAAVPAHGVDLKAADRLFVLRPVAMPADAVQHISVARRIDDETWQIFSPPRTVARATEATLGRSLRRRGAIVLVDPAAVSWSVGGLAGSWLVGVAILVAGLLVVVARNRMRALPAMAIVTCICLAACSQDEGLRTTIESEQIVGLAIGESRRGTISFTAPFDAVVTVRHPSCSCLKFPEEQFQVQAGKAHEVVFTITGVSGSDRNFPCQFALDTGRDKYTVQHSIRIEAGEQVFFSESSPRAILDEDGLSQVFARMHVPLKGGEPLPPLKWATTPPMGDVYIENVVRKSVGGTESELATYSLRFLASEDVPSGVHLCKMQPLFGSDIDDPEPLNLEIVR